MKVLGIETSCDDTAAGVVEDGLHVLSSVVASQLDIHGPFGGVVPELASRSHLEAVGPVVEAALRDAGVGFGDLDGIAATRGPGLVGSLLVGLSTGKALAFAHSLPILGVNHLEAHIRSVFLDHPDLTYPLLALVVSGGHTSLYFLPGEGTYEHLAWTRDDAAGEAFDKVAKYLGFGYPGGPVVDRLAARGNDSAYPFSLPRMTDGSMDFSFSGLKTAALYTMKKRGIEPRNSRVTGLASGPDLETSASQVTCDLFASFQKAVVGHLVQRTVALAAQTGATTVIVSGGVACNSRLRADIAAAGKQHGFGVAWPRPIYCSDNGAMVATTGCLMLREGRIGDLDMEADPSLRLGEMPPPVATP
ncbi:MAG: tRNA (adenosine(37)-N6)-threonylcarbamoyltransferase complex transferase subunit TsaD [Acidobacteriota bacterium]